MFWLIQIFTKLPLLFSKLSLTFVYRDLIRHVDHSLVKASRFLNYLLMIVLTGFFTAATLVSMFACTPVYKSWLPKTPGYCIDTTLMFNYVTGSVNVLTSICLICIPLPVLYLAKNRRIEIKQLTALVLFGLMCVFFLSFFLSLCPSLLHHSYISPSSTIKLEQFLTQLFPVIRWYLSCVSIWLLISIMSKQTLHVRLSPPLSLLLCRLTISFLPGRIIPTHIIIVVEMNITIIAASVVVMRPCFQVIFDSLFPKSPYASHNASNRRPSKYHRRRSDGYIVSPDETEGAARCLASISECDTGTGIMKTVDIELASKDASKENIVKGEILLGRSGILERPTDSGNRKHSTKSNRPARMARAIESEAWNVKNYILIGPEKIIAQLLFLLHDNSLNSTSDESLLIAELRAEDEDEIWYIAAFFIAPLDLTGCINEYCISAESTTHITSDVYWLYRAIQSKRFHIYLPFPIPLRYARAFVEKHANHNSDMDMMHALFSSSDICQREEENPLL